VPTKIFGAIPFDVCTLSSSCNLNSTKLSSGTLRSWRNKFLTFTVIEDMNIRILAMGTRGDVQPYGALGWACSVSALM